MSLDPVITNPENYKVVFENEMEAGTTGWIAAQLHSGENIGDTDTHVLFIELKVSNPPGSVIGPES